MTEYTPGLWWHTFVLVWSHVAAVYNSDVQLVRYAKVKRGFRNRYAAKARRSKR